VRRYRSSIAASGFSRIAAVVIACVMLSACGSKRGVYHQVQKGETLASIAKAYELDAATLATWNDLKDNSKVQPGDKLFVPGATKTLSAAKTGGGQKPVADAAPPRKKNGEKIASAEPAPKAAAVTRNPIRLRWPLDNPKRLSGFGPRDGRNHDGLDLGAPRGTKIRAAADGRVIYSDNGLRGYGNLVIIRHEGNWATVYAHNDKNLVEQDDFVRAGEVIATVGDTGVATTTHLHFELRDGKTPVDPAPYLP